MLVIMKDFFLKLVDSLKVNQILVLVVQRLNDSNKSFTVREMTHSFLHDVKCSSSQRVSVFKYNEMTFE